MNPSVLPANRDARIAELLQIRDAAEQELQELMGEQFDTIITNRSAPGMLQENQRGMATTQDGILNALPAHIALLDAQGNILAVNKAWRHFGSDNGLQRPDFLTGVNYLEVCERARGEFAEEALMVADGIRRVLRGELPAFSIEYPCHAPREKRWFRLMVTPLSEASHDGVVVMHINVTERRLAEEVLREREQAQRHLAEELAIETRRLHESQAVANVGSWEVDLVTSVGMWTMETYRIFGTTPEQYQPSYPDSLRFIHPEDRKFVDEVFTGSYHQPGSYSLEHRILCTDGVVKSVEQRWQILYDEAGKPKRAIGTCQDLTQRKKADAEMRRAAETLAEIVQIQQEVTLPGVPLQEIMNLMVERAQKLTGASGSAVGWIVGDEIVFRAVTGLLREHAGRRVQQKSTLAGMAVRTGAVLYSADSETDDRVNLAVCRSIQARSLVVAPISSGQLIVGVLKVISERPNAFSKRDVHNVQILVETLGVVLQRQHATEALQASMEEFRTLTEAMPQIVWTTLADGNTNYINQQWNRYTGLSQGEGLGHGWVRSLHPDDRERVLATWQAANATLETYSVECRLRRADGEYRWWLIRSEPLKDKDGCVLKWFGTCTDIHELKQAQLGFSRANRALKMLSGCHEALIRAANEPELLTAICEIVVRTGGYRMSWVGYAMDDARKSIVPQAHAGLEEKYLETVNATWDENHPSGLSPSGRVIRSGRTISIPDLASEPSFGPWMSNAQQRGYKSLVCLPLKDAHHTFGVLVLYLSEVRSLAPDELGLLHELADDLAFGIVTLRARTERRSLQEAVLAIAQGVSASVGTEFFERLNEHLVTALKADAGFISLLDAPGGTAARTVSALIGGKKVLNFEYSLAGTPCADVLNGKLRIVAREARQRFPEARMIAILRMEGYACVPLMNSEGLAVGVIEVLFREPIQQTDFVSSALQIFAARAASEMERQRADTQVREQVALLDKARDAIIVRDLDHVITYWNKSAERLFGWTAEDARGRTLGELLEIDPAKLAEADRMVREFDEWNGEIQERSKAGVSLTLDCRWTLVRDAAGEATSILSIDTDITERKRLEQQFLRAQRMESIGTLAGGIAHDLNNSLGPIIMALDLLKMKFDDPGSQELLDIISSSAKRGANMVRQVLSFARGVSGERMEVQVAHLIKDIEKITNETFLKHIQVRSGVAPGLWVVLGDPTQLHQVLMNLCVNARDAMPHGGVLTISAENLTLDDHYAGLNPDAHAGPYLYISVEDTGIGMSPEIMERIFDPFFTTKELGHGTGLGLSTSLAIIKSHGGFIRVNSEVGKGTTFEIYLPAQTEAVVSETAPVAVELPRGNGELILVVDDEASVRQITRQTLEAFGYRVVLASDGAEAVATYASRGAEIAVVLTDMMMPVMDGPATIKVLRIMNPNLPIIAASGLTKGQAVPIPNLGVKHFLSKPFTAEILLKALHQILKNES